MNIAIAIAAIAVAPQSQNIDDYVQKALRDATFVARVVKGDQRELRKINDDFGQSYRFDTTTVRVKEPFKLRIEANVEDTDIVYVINGAMQLISVPRSRLNQKTNLSNAPGRRQSLLEFGILTPSLFDGLFNAKFVRMDRATGDAVFDLFYLPATKDNTRHRIWIDPKQKIVTKREWFNQVGRQLATFTYEAPQQVSGVWIPTRLTVRNVEGKVAGITRYDTIKVNTGLPDSLFTIR